MAHLSDGLPVKTYQAGSINCEIRKSVCGQALPDCRDVFDLVSGVRKRIVHVAFKRGVEAWIYTDGFTQFDHGPYVPVIPERNSEGSFC